MQPDPSGLELPDLAGLIERPKWFRRAACREEGSAQFFPGKGQSLERARALCDTCVVRSECLDYALADADTVGVWGGLSTRERAQIRRSVA
jgi:WhiB family transcriptional regulator, redox-sensing transcriptional regulator